MANFGDCDGKSKTASTVDAGHYPHMGKSQHHPLEHRDSSQSVEEIAERAYQIYGRRKAVRKIQLSRIGWRPNAN